MAAPNPSLAEELKSLRSDRAPEKRGLPRWLLPAAAVVIVVAIGLFAWKTLGNRLFAPEVDTATVALITPAQGAQLLVATGYVVPQRKANISPRIGGRVAKIFVEDGTVAKAGQVIAVLEDADYRAQLAQPQADLKAAQAREKRAEVDLHDAQRQYDREQIVQAKGVSTPAALDAANARLGVAKAGLAAGEADVAAARARVEVARVNLDNCYVRAPFSGRFTQKLTDIGEIVFGFTSAGNAGNGGIASLADFDTLQGAKQDFLADRNSCLVGKSLAEKYGWKIGDTIPLFSEIYPGDWKFRVAGIIEGTDDQSVAKVMYFPWARLNEAMPATRKDMVGLFTATVANASESPRVIRDIDALFANSDNETHTETEKAFRLSFVTGSGAILSALETASGVILIVMALILGNTLAMGLRERTPDKGRWWGCSTPEARPSRARSGRTPTRSRTLRAGPDTPP